MSCPSWNAINPACQAGDAWNNYVAAPTAEAVTNAASSAFDRIADSAGKAAGEMMVNAMSWWTHTGTVNPDYGIETTDGRNQAIANIQSDLIPVVAIILMASMLFAAARMMITRKGQPAIDIVWGLGRFFVITTIAGTVLAGACAAGDSFSAALLDKTAENFGTKMSGLFSIQVITNPFSLLSLGSLAFLLGAIQWVIGFARQAGILVLAALIPLAASGLLSKSTATWWPKVAATLVGLVVYKPIVAVIYAIGFTYIADAQDLATALTGVMVLVLSVVALPVLLKFFSWAQPALASGGGGGVIAAAGAVGAVSLAAAPLRSAGVQQASMMESSGPGSGSNGGASPTGASPTRAGIASGAGGAAGADVANAGTKTGAAAAASGGPVGAGIAAGAAAGAQVTGAIRQAGTSAGERMTGGEQQ